MLALGLGATALLLHSFLLVLDKGLVSPLLGQTKASTAAQTPRMAATRMMRERYKPVAGRLGPARRPEGGPRR